MKNLNEYSTGYPTSLSNSQSQEYQGALGPVDAETVQGKDRLNPLDPEGLHRINVFLKQFFRRSTLNPQYELAQLRARLNHLNLDFDLNITKKIEPTMNIEVNRGQAFGVTPTTDLSKGFYNGEDLPKFNLNVKVNKIDGGYQIDAAMTPKGGVTEAAIAKTKRNKRISTIKEMRNMVEQVETSNATAITDLAGAKEEETKKDRVRANDIVARADKFYRRSRR